MAIKNFCYCIGGTGTRVAEVAGHLCAMNMVGKQDITFIIVDKDTACGGTKKAKDLLDTVTALSDINKHPDTALIRSGNKENEFCKSLLEVESWDFSDVMTSLSKASDGGSSLAASLTESDEDKILLSAFYSYSEQRRNTSQGFYGHPSIGALVFKHMIQKGKWENTDPQNFTVKPNDVAAPVKNFLSQNAANVARIFIIGSVFGGTGASVFSNLAHHIRNSVPDDYSNRTFISGVLLLPYFSFESNNGDLIDPKEFYSKSKVALEQYHNDKNLMRKNGQGSFDSLYLCGQDPLHFTARKYSHGGKGQENYFDFVDVAAAYAMTNFFNARINNSNGKFNLDPAYRCGMYEFDYSTTTDDVIPQVNLEHIPEDLVNSLKGMSVFVAHFITKVYLSLLKDDPSNSHILNRLFTKDELVTYANSQKSEDVKKIADRVFGYCCSFVNFMVDLTHNGCDHTDKLIGKSYENEYAIFNRDYFDKLKLIIEQIKKGNYDSALDASNDTIARKKPSKTIFNPHPKHSEYKGSEITGLHVQDVDDHLKRLFDGNNKADNYKNNNIEVNKRVGDFVHEAFIYCYKNA